MRSGGKKKRYIIYYMISRTRGAKKRLIAPINSWKIFEVSREKEKRFCVREGRRNGKENEADCTGTEFDRRWQTEEEEEKSSLAGFTGAKAKRDEDRNSASQSEIFRRGCRSETNGSTRVNLRRP